MNTYLLTLQHDAGTVILQTTAQDDAAARQKICTAEGCPPGAIIKSGLLESDPDDNRPCAKCGEQVNQGYVVYGGEKYYHTECMPYTARQWRKMCQHQYECYWTAWED